MKAVFSCPWPYSHKEHSPPNDRNKYSQQGLPLKALYIIPFFAAGCKTQNLVHGWIPWAQHIRRWLCRQTNNGDLRPNTWTLIPQRTGPSLAAATHRSALRPTSLVEAGYGILFSLSFRHELPPLFLLYSSRFPLDAFSELEHGYPIVRPLWFAQTPLATPSMEVWMELLEKSKALAASLFALLLKRLPTLLE